MRLRVVIYDGILESHVGDSLALAFSRRGHDVLNTGMFGEGFRFPTDAKYLQRIDYWVNRVIEFEPDLVIVMRPASLPIESLRRLRGEVRNVFAWFCDDPVLYELSYGSVVDEYEMILHCGNDSVIEFYDHQHGRATGVNVPFWTDPEFFPYVYGSREKETDLIFLGNAQGDLRRSRYHDLSRLRHSVRLHGRIGTDFRSVGGGYLDTDTEVVDAGSRAHAAINIPQYFTDHRGMETWFTGLADLGSFQYPSRVIQYAAMGLPVFDVGREKFETDSFPELISVPDVASIDEFFLRMDESDWNELSRSTHARFLRNFSADSRAVLIENLVLDDSWRALGVADRARYFTRFEPENSHRPEQSETLTTRDRVEVQDNQISGRATPSEEVRSCDIVVLLEPDHLDRWSRAGGFIDYLKNNGHHVTLIGLDEAADKQIVSPIDAINLKINPKRLFHSGHRLDVLMVLTSEPLRLERGEDFGIRTVWVDELFTGKPAEILGRAAAYDFVITTNDLGNSPSSWIYLPPVVNESVLWEMLECTGLLDAQRDTDQRGVEKTPRVYAGASDKASMHYYPEVFEESKYLLASEVKQFSPLLI